jgi:hypothetical protein
MNSNSNNNSNTSTQENSNKEDDSNNEEDLVEEFGKEEFEDDYGDYNEE